jgi:integrase
MAGYPKKEKNGTYYFVLEAGRDADGNRKRIKRRGFKKISEAKTAMAELMLDLKNGNLNSLNENMSLNQYLDYWLENYAKTNTKPKTFVEYEKIINTHIKPALGHIHLHELKSVQLQTYYKLKLKSLSAQTVKHHHRLLSKVLNDAIGWELISNNATKGAKPPKPEKTVMKTLSAEQLKVLTKTAKEKTPVYSPIIHSAAHTGMRKSELVGLSWENVDFITEKVYICQTITEANGKFYFNRIPKNEQPRGVKMTKELLRAMETLKEEHDHRKKILGESYNPHNLVFCNSKGNIMASSEISRSLKKALKAAKLPNIRFHDLRHSHATILLKKGVHPKIVSERLGHSNIQITLDLYSHVTDSIEAIAVETLNELFE